MQLAFAIVWDGFLVFWYVQAARSGNAVGLLFPILHAAAGFYLTYGAIAGLFNRTVIAASKDKLSIRHGPIPWPGNRDIPTADLKQLFCEEVITRGKNGPSATYHLAAMLDDGKKIRLIKSLPEPDQALYLEQALESRLGIVDVEMEGEYLRR
jgi:hypothetical protein